MANFKKSWKKFTKKVKKATRNDYKKMQRNDNIFTGIVAAVFLVVMLVGAISLTDTED
jgi:hypothetical protein